MQHLWKPAILCALIVMFAWQEAPLLAEPKEGDWAGGWSTWKDAEKGDWAEYSLGSASYKYEVTKVSGANITHVHTTYNKGEETSSREKTKPWTTLSKFRMPYGKENEVVWSEEDVKLGEVMLKCDKAKWTIGSSTTEFWLCKDVPCGGLVKQSNNGKDILWVTAYNSAKSGSAKTDKPDNPVEDVKSEMPRFYAAADNFVVLKITIPGRDEMYQLRKVLNAQAKSAGWMAVACNADGVADANAKLTEAELTKEDWDKDFGKPDEKDVKITIAAGDFVCDVYKSKDEKKGTETTEWISEGAPVKKVIKSKSGETVLEATKVVMK